jgi:hypothetical protein
MATYVLVHDAFHTGKDLEPTASPIREAGHRVHTPTIAGNKPGDPKTVGIEKLICESRHTYHQSQSAKVVLDRSDKYLFGARLIRFRSFPLSE